MVFLVPFSIEKRREAAFRKGQVFPFYSGDSRLLSFPLLLSALFSPSRKRFPGLQSPFFFSRSRCADIFPFFFFLRLVFLLSPATSDSRMRLRAIAFPPESTGTTPFFIEHGRRPFFLFSFISVRPLVLQARNNFFHTPLCCFDELPFSRTRRKADLAFPPADNSIFSLRLLPSLGRPCF